MTDYTSCPIDLPAPIDDGACSHLQDLPLPNISLQSTSGKKSDLFQLPGKTILFVYPMIGTPGVALPQGWNETPGARGCTPESLAFKDSFEEFKEKGYKVLGLSTQSSAEQSDAVKRLSLPFDLLSDPHDLISKAIGLPHFECDGKKYLKRVTLLIKNGTIERIWYPVFPTDAAAQMVLKDL